MTQSTPMLLITDERLGHSDVHIDDDDFVDPPSSRKGTSIHEDSPSGERIHVMQVVDELRNYFKGQISDLQSENRLPSKEFQAMQSHVSSLKSDQQKKLKLLVCIQASQFVAKTSKEIEVQVDSIISNVLKETECIEQEAKLKYMYPRFKDKTNVFVIDDRLIDDITGVRISLSTPWAKVDLVFIPLLPTNKAHWTLGVLDIKAHTLHVLNSFRKTYNDIKVRIGTKPFVSILSHSMKCIRIWKKDFMELNVDLDFSLSQPKNG
ncbi:Ulp1 protease family, C-terminal catalytic domain containing [Olea europaea subsp. europaea]|uniref:Ulp1 protease family, C-terminal catalytic domain containing n=1 Tax=Olea europaea subsp. europaea TaxID=158383 RepID=A0A8S0RMW0_OLEEU|nr:Ulp1 protease family, C-terminal catalytic domain containing [Olea europaea subsp. europaea]